MPPKLSHRVQLETALESLLEKLKNEIDIDNDPYGLNESVVRYFLYQIIKKDLNDCFIESEWKRKDLAVFKDGQLTDLIELKMYFRNPSVEEDKESSKLLFRKFKGGPGSANNHETLNSINSLNRDYEHASKWMVIIVIDSQFIDRNPKPLATYEERLSESEVNLQSFTKIKSDNWIYDNKRAPFKSDNELKLFYKRFS